MSFKAKIPFSNKKMLFSEPEIINYQQKNSKISTKEDNFFTPKHNIFHTIQSHVIQYIKHNI